MITNLLKSILICLPNSLELEADLFNMNRTFFLNTFKLGLLVNLNKIKENGHD